MKIIFLLLVSIMIYGCENSKFQTKEQYIANPIGCENHQPDWFLEQLKTPEGQEKLRIIIIDLQITDQVFAVWILSNLNTLCGHAAVTIDACCNHNTISDYIMRNTPRPCF